MMTKIHFGTNLRIIRLTEALPGSGANARLPCEIKTSPQLSFNQFPFDRIAFIVGVIDSLTAFYPH
jgi:hypothetical protein